jgi:hypothetical protein
MNIPPILERLLLSNEAVFKNATLGLNSLNLLYVPPGKTAVILGYEINAFCNAYTLGTLWENGIEDSLYEAILPIINQHINYQMQILNDSYFTAFTHSPDFSIIPIPGGPSAAGPAPTISLQFKQKSEDLFIYVDKSTYFQLVFQDFETMLPYYKAFNVSFQSNIQPIPGVPISFSDSAIAINNYSFTAAAGTPGNVENYNPTRKEQIEASLYNSYNLPAGEQEYLRYGTNSAAADLEIPFPAMPVPPTDPLPMPSYNMFVLPTINVKYALINKRASDYGIAAPKG